MFEWLLGLQENRIIGKYCHKNGNVFEDDVL